VGKKEQREKTERRGKVGIKLQDVKGVSRRDDGAEALREEGWGRRVQTGRLKSIGEAPTYNTSLQTDTF